MLNPSVADHPATHGLNVSARIGSAILAYSIALPLFGRSVFPMVRDKAGITLASSFSDPQMLATYVLAAVLAFRLCVTPNFLGALRTRAMPAFLMFAVACLTSALTSGYLLFSLWRSFEIFLLMTWAFLMIQDRAGQPNVAFAIRTFYVVSVGILIGVAVGVVIDPNGAWTMEGDVARLAGTSGYMINPNDVGAIAAVLALASYVRTVEHRSAKFAVATVALIAVCYLSHSRGSYISLAAGFIVATIMLGRAAHRRLTLALTSMSILIAVGAITLSSSALLEFFEFLMTRGHAVQNLESFGGRLQLWELGLKVFWQHPFLGTGYGTYPQGLEGGHFHNVLIELLVTTGIAGLLCYVAFIFALIMAVRHMCRRLDRTERSERIVAADICVIPTVILVANCAT